MKTLYKGSKFGYVPRFNQDKGTEMNSIEFASKKKYSLRYFIDKMEKFYGRQMGENFRSRGLSLQSTAGFLDVFFYFLVCYFDFFSPLNLNCLNWKPLVPSL